MRILTYIVVAVCYLHLFTKASAQETLPLKAPPYRGTVFRYTSGGQVQQGSMTLEVGYAFDVGGTLTVAGETTSFLGFLERSSKSGYFKFLAADGSFVPGIKIPLTMKNGTIVGGAYGANGDVLAFRLIQGR